MLWGSSGHPALSSICVAAVPLTLYSKCLSLPTTAQTLLGLEDGESNWSPCSEQREQGNQNSLQRPNTPWTRGFEVLQRAKEFTHLPPARSETT